MRSFSKEMTYAGNHLVQFGILNKKIKIMAIYGNSQGTTVTNLKPHFACQTPLNLSNKYALLINKQVDD